MGKIEASRFLATSFKMSRDRLFGQYNLSQDGAIRLDKDAQDTAYFQLAADFSSFAVAGDRLIRHMTDWVNKLFENGSRQKVYWKELTSKSFDKSLAYAFFDAYRDEIEHGFAPISIVNYNRANKTVGAAINLEAGILNRKIKSSVKKRLREFRIQRLRDGLTPWVSVAGISREYSELVTSLYAIFLHLVVDEVALRRVKVNYSEVGIANCIFWKVGNENQDYSIDRVYGLTDDAELQLVRYEIARLYRELRDEGKKNDEIESYCNHLIENVISGGSLFDKTRD